MSGERFDKVLAKARAALGLAGGFDRRVTLDFGPDGAVHVDGPAGTVEAAPSPADCTVRVKLDDFIAIAKGALDPARAYLSGQLKVEGDFGLAIELARRMRAAGEA